VDSVEQKMWGRWGRGRELLLSCRSLGAATSPGKDSMMF